MRANAKQSHDAGIELLKIVELYKQFRPELDDNGFETGDIEQSRSGRAIYRIAHQARWWS